MSTTKKIDGIMSQNTEIKREAHPFKFFGMMLPTLPSLMFRVGETFLRFKRNAKKAGKVFKKELIKQGFDSKTAKSLTKIYLEGSDISKYVFNF
jgi:hypothetical protein